MVNHEWNLKTDDVASTETAEIIRSTVSGTGVIARRDIKKGEIVLPLTGQRLRSDQIDGINRSQSLLQIDEDLYLMATGTIDDFLNHSCDPNLGFTPDGMNYMALRDIKTGEEMFWDYSTCENDAIWSMDCLCGSAKCRGKVRGYPNLDKETRKRLLPISLPYLRKLYMES